MEQSDYRLAAVLYIDIAGFRDMMAADERASLELLTEYNRAVTRVAGEFHGSVIKTDADALLLDFPSTVDAFRCVEAVLPAIASIGPVPGSTGERTLEARAGLHTGDVYFRENDALGEGVAIAGGLRRIARPGALAVSAEVYHQIRGKLVSIPVHEYGERRIDGVDRPITVYELGMDGEPVGGNGQTGHAGTAGAAGAAGHAGATTGSTSGGTGDARFEEIRRAVREWIRAHGRRPTAADLAVARGALAALTPGDMQRLVASGLVQSASGGGDSSSAARSRDAGPQWESAEDDEFDRDSRSPGARILKGLKRILKQSGRSDAEVYQAYREEFARRMKGERAGLAGHTTSFIGVNAMLIAIWFFTGAGFPWYLFPLLGWGIGYVSHRISVDARETEFSQVEAMDRPTRRQLSLHRELWKSRRKFRGHVASTGMTAALLGTINVVTGVGFPWALIPIGFMTIGALGHWRQATREQAELVEELDRSGFALPDSWRKRRGGANRLAGGGIGGAGAAGGAGDGADPATAARSIRAELLRDIKSMKETPKSLGDDFKSVLDTYVTQIESLSAALQEIDRLIADIPIADLDANRRRLEAQVAACADERLAAEYRRSIEQIDSQRRSYSELNTEREMLALRAENAVGALKQLRIDVARARSTRSRTAETSLEDLRSRSSELSQYLSDLREAYEEL